MKGTMGALKFNILEQIVEFEETFIHPVVNYTTSCTQFALAHPLALVDYAMENYKVFLGMTQTLFDMPITGHKEINLFNPQRQLEFLHHATPEYLSSVHAAIDHIKNLTGYAPHVVGLCQMGYFNAWNLADYPDDANTFVLAGAPFDPRLGDNFLKRFADSLSMQDIDDYLQLSGNLMAAKRMAKGWRLMADENYYTGSSATANIGNRHIKLFHQMLDDDFSTERDYVFKSWMDKDVVADIAGGLYRDLFSFFKYGTGAECIADKDFSRISCPTAVLTGGKDDISPEDTCVAIFDHISSTVRTHFHNPLVGHAGIYNSEKAITDSYDANNWQNIMEWMKENSKYL